MSGNGDHHRQGRRFAVGGNGHDGRDPRDVEIERLRQWFHKLEINPFTRYERQYEDTPTDTVVEEYENEGWHSKWKNSYQQNKNQQLVLALLAMHHSCPVRVGPIKADPPALTSVSPTSTTSSLCCFNCQRIGHLKRGCPNKQVLTLIDEADPLYDTEDEVETEVVYPDRGELLVTCRLLNTAVLDQDDDTTWLRTNIFRTQCTTKGKICTVIIDGGSYENMVSTTMVEKLVYFSVSNKYTDELWCEVIPMDACHILLGRSWLYDHRVKHDGYRNTYTFKKDGVSITFAPLNPKDASPDRVLISKTDFVGIVKVSSPSVIFRLLMIEENPIIAAAPLSMVPLLNEFKYVFPEELLAGLHMIREIRLGAKLNFSTSHHPQIDGQTEAEFAYKQSNHSSTGRSSFFIMYGRNPFTPLDLAPMVGDGSVSAEGDERARQIKELHAQLHPRADGPFRILKKINDNAYKVEFPGHYGVYDTFNVADLSSYTSNANFDDDSGSSRFLKREDDTDQGGSPLSPTKPGPLKVAMVG
nr:hypothetical protein [Tanacetum cinerariifolium]